MASRVAPPNRGSPGAPELALGIRLRLGGESAPAVEPGFAAEPIAAVGTGVGCGTPEAVALSPKRRPRSDDGGAAGTETAEVSSVEG